MAGTTPNGIGPYPQQKLLDVVVRTPGRLPSPQPTLLGVQGTNLSNNSRILHEPGPGYVAPKFEGKEQQKEDGEYSTL
jgi:glutamate dehydrogenase